MKTLTTLLAALLVLGVAGRVAAQEAEGTENAAAAVSPEASSLPLALAEDQTNAPPRVSAELYRSLGLAELGVSTNALVISAISNRLDLIQTRSVRLEGGLVPAIRQPSFATLLQLVNPFAPEEYGGVNVSAAGQGFGRVFDDPVEAKTGATLISVGDNPPRSDEPVRLKND